MKIAATYFAFIFIQCISIINGDVDDIEITSNEFCEVKNAMDFTGKVALITGSSSGIGAATARLLSYLGAKCVVTGRNATRVNDVVRDCSKLSPHNIKPLGIVLDLTVPGNMQKLINETIKHYKKIDIVVNGAGVGLFGSITDPIFDENYKQNKLVNEDLAVELTRLSLPYLAITRGSIVLIASILASNPIGGTAPYSMAKNALVAFATSIAHDVGPDIRVNVISPGVCDGTRIFRYMNADVRRTLIANTIASAALKRAAVPLDIAKTIVFYVSDLATYMTGFNTEVTGGLSVKLL